MRISTEQLYHLCNKYHWFTNGTIQEYRKLFERNRENAPLETLATIIWLCSDGVDEQEILEILKKERDL